MGPMELGSTRHVSVRVAVHALVLLSAGIPGVHTQRPRPEPTYPDIHITDPIHVPIPEPFQDFAPDDFGWGPFVGNMTFPDDDFPWPWGDEDYSANATAPDNVPPADCSGHGARHADATLSKCECETAAPGVPNMCAANYFHYNFSGYAGNNCQIEVQSMSDEDGEVQQQVHNLRLAHDRMACHTVCWGDKPWNYLAVQLARDSSDGDPDLYGLLYSNGMDQWAFPEDSNRGTSFDFMETSGASRQQVQQLVKREDVHKAESGFTGAALCVHAYGQSDIEYSLRWQLGQCPVRFTPSGEALVCSSPVDGPSAAAPRRGMCDSGQCRCERQYQAPTEGYPPGVGFEDCSAEMSAFKGAKGVDMHTLPPDFWKFYEFEVKQGDNQVVFDLLPNNVEEGGHPTVYLRHGQPPGPRYSEHDLQSDDFSWGEDSFKTSQQITLNREDEHFRYGKWFVGVTAQDGVRANYTLAFNKYECPLDCSGHGQGAQVPGGWWGAQQCHDGNCTCDDGFISPPRLRDCSAEVKELTFGEERREVMAVAEYSYFIMPYVTNEMARRNVELTAAVAFRHNVTQWSRYGFWMQEPPVLLLKHGAADDYPHAQDDGYDFRVVMEKPNRTYTVTVPASALDEGHWKAAVYNPTRLDPIVFNLTMELHAYCPNNCTSATHGTCNADGSCTCKSGFSGADCGFQTSNCENVWRGTEQITCFKPCKCEALRCGYIEHCEQCAAPFRLQRKVDNPAMACVRDECTEPGLKHQPVAHLTCMLPCLQPMDEGVRRLGEDCMEGTVQCHSPYVLAADGSACVAPEPAPTAAKLHQVGVQGWVVWLVAVLMLCVGAGSGVGAVLFYQYRVRNSFNNNRPIWHDLDDEGFSMANF